MQKLTVPRLTFAAAVFGLVATTGMHSPAAAQLVNGIVVIDVMIINDDGGTLTNPEVTFIHTNETGQQTATTGTDDDPMKCLTSDGATCHIGIGPIGAGRVTVPLVDGYTIDTQCVGGFPPSSGNGASFDLAEAGEVFCVIMLDDIAPTPDTTTTIAPTTTAAPATTAAPTTVAPATLAPTTVLPETGPEDTGSLALIALALLATGLGTMSLSRRRA